MLGAGFIKFYQLFQRSLVRGRGGGGHSTSAFYSVKLCVMINFSLRHNVLCFSFVVVLYSMYSLHAKLLKWFSLMKEIVMCNNNLKLKSPLTRSTDHQSLLKYCNFDFAHFLRGVCVCVGGGDSYLKFGF